MVEVKLTPHSLSLLGIRVEIAPDAATLIELRATANRLIQITFIPTRNLQ